MRLSKKAEASLDRMIERFQEGDVGSLVAVAAVGLAEDAPMRNWSYSNRVLALAQTGSLDSRGYRQWQEKGRQVPQGERGGFILYPKLKKVEDDDELELCGFGTAAVFGYHQTEPIGDDAMTYEPQDPPPLTEIAERLEVSVCYGPLAGAYGMVDTEGQKVTMNSHDPYPFLHEIGHAAEARLNGKLTPGQDVEQETRAELVACVLADVYGLGDYTGNAWQYIEHYADSPIKAIQAAADDIGPILELILAQKETPHEDV